MGAEAQAACACGWRFPAELNLTYLVPRALAEAIAKLPTETMIRCPHCGNRYTQNASTMMASNDSELREALRKFYGEKTP